MAEKCPVAELRDNAALSRFELDEPGGVVFADYRRTGDRLVITHVETPLAMRGAGAAGRLMEAVAALARREDLTIVPVCSYAAAWLHRHPQH
jgi:predicted GNAT family acetyltransferase